MWAYCIARSRNYLLDIFESTDLSACFSISQQLFPGHSRRYPRSLGSSRLGHSSNLQTNSPMSLSKINRIAFRSLLFYQAGCRCRDGFCCLRSPMCWWFSCWWCRLACRWAYAGIVFFILKICSSCWRLIRLSDKSPTLSGRIGRLCRKVEHRWPWRQWSMYLLRRLSFCGIPP